MFSWKPVTVTLSCNRVPVDHLLLGREFSAHLSCLCQHEPPKFLSRFALSCLCKAYNGLARLSFHLENKVSLGFWHLRLLLNTFAITGGTD